MRTALAGSGVVDAAVADGDHLQSLCQGSDHRTTTVGKAWAPSASSAARSRKKVDQSTPAAVPRAAALSVTWWSVTT
jgi:hypothetical protein